MTPTPAQIEAAARAIMQSEGNHWAGPIPPYDPSLRAAKAALTAAAEAREKPSDYCCLNFGCIQPDVCNEIGYSCGDPRVHEVMRDRARVDDFVKKVEATTIERCAQVARETALHWNVPAVVAEHIAAAIRALKDAAEAGP